MSHGKNNRIPADKANRPPSDKAAPSATPPEDLEALRKAVKTGIYKLDDSRMPALYAALIRSGIIDEDE